MKAMKDKQMTTFSWSISNECIAGTIDRYYEFTM